MIFLNGPDFLMRRRRLAKRLRRDTEHWLVQAMRTGLDPRVEYARMLETLPCYCDECRCAPCKGSAWNCNAA